jgi:hypothetical protein
MFGIPPAAATAAAPAPAPVAASAVTRGPPAVPLSVAAAPASAPVPTSIARHPASNTNTNSSHVASAPSAADIAAANARTASSAPPSASISYARVVAPTQQQPAAQVKQAGAPPGVPVSAAVQSGAAAEAVAAAAAAAEVGRSFFSTQPKYTLTPPIMQQQQQPGAPVAAGPGPGPAGAVSRDTSTGAQSTASGSTSSNAFSAKKPLLFSPDRGFSTTDQPQKHRKELPKGKYMSPSDVRYARIRLCEPYPFSFIPFLLFFIFIDNSFLVLRSPCTCVRCADM